MARKPQFSTRMAVNERLGNLIKQAEQAVIGTKTHVLKPFDLSVPQYAALAVLAEQPDISGAHLARVCGVTAQAMNGVITLLEQRGLIARTPSADHAKVLLTRLTEAGVLLLREADAAAVAVEQRLAGAYTDGERAQLRSSLQTAIDTLNQIRQETAT